MSNKMLIENLTFPIHLYTPIFILKDTSLVEEDGVILYTYSIDDLIDLETGKAPEVSDAICANTESGYELYDIVPQYPYANYPNIDNWLSASERVYRISGLHIKLNHKYELDGVVGTFQFSEDSNESLVFIPNKN